MLMAAMLAIIVIMSIAACGFHKLALLAAILLFFIAVSLSTTSQASDMPPFRIADPMCNTGFTISQRLDTRNAAGTIIKSVWVRKCTNGRIVYGRKV